MFPPHDSPLTIAGACALLWLVIWFSARHPTIRNWTVGIAAVYLPLGSCVVAAEYIDYVPNKNLCAQGIVPCQKPPIDWGSWIPITVWLAVIGCLALWMNAKATRLRADDILQNRTQAPTRLYFVALIMRIQPVLLAFVGMSVLFWASDSDKGQSFLATLLLFLLFGTVFPLTLLWLVVRVNQLGKWEKGWAVMFSLAPAAYSLLLLSNDNSSHLLNLLSRPGGDSRYLALVIFFLPLSAYALLGEVLANKIHVNLEALEYLTSPWVGNRPFDPGPTLNLLRRIGRSAHVVAVITAGVAIGFIPPALHLPDVLGMIVGVGFVALVSYLDAELASRHLDDDPPLAESPSEDTVG
ncbi:hypothetical protein [Mycobacteroides chelonae]|uniref:hypothetical protein n=1 Tax=Mycobacteroides chelonae TaxID=1774 RepID=UPI0012FF5DD2|nr:hypothetical protein [Mycobacteroides chelonae]